MSDSLDWGDDATGQAIATSSRRIGQVIVGIGVNHQGTAILVKNATFSWRQGNQICGHGVISAAIGLNPEIRQITGMGTIRIQKAMVYPAGIEMATGRGKIGWTKEALTGFQDRADDSRLLGD